jgi:hypothetical protein
MDAEIDRMRLEYYTTRNRLHKTVVGAARNPRPNSAESQDNPFVQIAAVSTANEQPPLASRQPEDSQVEASSILASRSPTMPGAPLYLESLQSYEI